MSSANAAELPIRQPLNQLPSQPLSSLSRRPWKLRSQILVANLILAALIVATFSISMFVISLHATYRRAEADLLAAAQELILQLKQQPTPETLEVSDLYRHRFGMAPRDRAYLALWDEHGTRIFATPDLPDHATAADRLPTTIGPHPFQTRSTGRFLDLIVQTPQRGQLLIGRPLAKEWDGLIWLSLRLIGLSILCLCGAAVLAVGLANRLSRPIDQLVRSAQNITERDSGQRLLTNEGSSIEVIQLGRALNELVARLQSAIERQTRFVADASHELRTPVTVILSQAEHTLHKDRSIEAYKASLDVCLQSARRMKRLTDDLLFLAKADSQKLCLSHDVIDLAQTARSSIGLLQPLAQTQSIQIEHDLQPASVYGDSERISQVLTNLIANAIRYNRPGGRVIVRTSTIDASALIEVQDDGIGISAEDQRHIFERFYQSDSARTQYAEAGSGLGLSLVHEIVMAHGGSINVHSALGAGTTFTVSLPPGTNQDTIKQSFERNCE